MDIDATTQEKEDNIETPLELFEEEKGEHTKKETTREQKLQKDNRGSKPRNDDEPSTSSNVIKKDKKSSNTLIGVLLISAGVASMFLL